MLNADPDLLTALKAKDWISVTTLANRESSPASLLALSLARFVTGQAVDASIGIGQLSLAPRAQIPELDRDVSTELAHQWGQQAHALPDDCMPVIGRALALAWLGGIDEAASVLQRAPCPTDVRILERLVEIALSRQDWREAERLIRTVIEHGENPGRLLVLANVLLNQQRYAEADILLKEGIALFPDSFELTLAYAAGGMRYAARQDWIARFQHLDRKFPNSPATEFCRLILNSEAGDLNNVHDALDRMEQKSASPVWALELFKAKLAVREGRLIEAVSLWEELLRRTPDNYIVITGLRDAKILLHRSDPSYPPPECPGTPEIRNFVSGMESLGDGCEIGMVQRHYGVEQLGLLCWTTIYPNDLIHALHSRFEGLGDDAQTAIRVSHSAEYMILDTRYNTSMHSFVYEHSIDRETFLRRTQRRQKFLSEKLLTDIRNSEKLFVYKNAAISDEQCAELFAALHAIGRARLLIVRLSDADNPCGSVKWIDDGLLLGHLDRFGIDGAPHNGMSLKGWELVFASALDLLGADAGSHGRSAST